MNGYDVETSFSIEEARNELGGTKVHAIIVQKGGTGKTTSCSSIAYEMAHMGLKVLAIDTDSQASLTGLCNVLPDSIDESEDDYVSLSDVFNYMIDCKKNREEPDFEVIKDAILRPTFKNSVRKTDADHRFYYEDTDEEFGFDLIAADESLAGYETTLNTAYKGDGGMILYDLIRIIKENCDYDYILLDCPPGLGFLASASIAAAVDGCIIPINLEIMALRGCKNVINLVAGIQEELRIRKHINHKGVLGMLKNEYVARIVSQRNFNDVVRKFFPIPAFDTTIPSSSKCNAAHSIGRLFSQYDKKAGKVYEQLVKEIVAEDIRRNGETDSPIIESFGEAEAELRVGKKFEGNEK